MFEAFLEAHDLASLLINRTCPYPVFADREGWAKIPVRLQDQLRRMSEKYRAIPYPLCRATDFMAFVRSGSRTAYEQPYFDRRRKLCSAVVSCCLDGDAALLDDVIDGIWCICEESTWVISAHNGSAHRGMRPASERPLPDVENPYIDLFAAQTAMILALTAALLGDELDRVAPVLRRRIQLETERRVLVPFLTRDDYWWMGFIRKDLCNWTPWIVSNVMLTACIWIPEKPRLAVLLSRACRMLDRYLDCMPEDGGCDEGAAYWNMAGGALFDCLELLEYVTGGQMTFWQDRKLRNILSFPARVQLDHGWYVNFSDCDARPLLSGERLRAIGKKLKDPRVYATGLSFEERIIDQVSDTPQLWRLLNILFHPADQTQVQTEIPPRDVWLPDLQVRILDRCRMTLVAKGGHNGESHNHNDVGSFMLYVDGEPEILDAGNMLYTAKTFSEERYTLWNTRSMNHNVPLIGGVEQQAGREYRAERVTRHDDGLEAELAKAYPAEAKLLSCHRRTALTDDGMILTDELETAEPKPVTWVLMLCSRPAIEGNTVQTGKLILTFPTDVQLDFTGIPVTDSRMAKNYPGSLWRLTADAAPSVRHELRFIATIKA